MLFQLIHNFSYFVSFFSLFEIQKPVSEEFLFIISICNSNVLRKTIQDVVRNIFIRTLTDESLHTRLKLQAYI